MAVTNFIPEIWNASILAEFQQSAVAAALTNSDYTGDATKGNTVKVTTRVPVEIKDYKTGVVMDDQATPQPIPRTTAPDTVSTTQVDLLIDQEKSFDFLIDDIDRAQAAGSLETFSQSAASGLVEDADKFILAQLYAANSPLTASAMTTPVQAWNKIRDLKKALDKAKVPQAQRVLAINAEYVSLLMDHESKITSVDTSGTPAGLRDATLGRILGFTVYQSENLPNVAKPQAIAWHTSAYAFVSQVTETEAMRAERTFADRLRGLHVYGGKPVRSTAIAAFTAS
ncbi:P22 phage major capsid protein family protein [Demequina sp. SO4-18]|uniref:P22 phage major capsid protein family protein n=1 Tax=Demequina sp. SO4-18 TaxID=3401026 RepID=UPI003B5B7B3D